MALRQDGDLEARPRLVMSQNADGLAFGSDFVAFAQQRFGARGGPDRQAHGRAGSSGALQPGVSADSGLAYGAVTVGR